MEHGNLDPYSITNMNVEFGRIDTEINIFLEDLLVQIPEDIANDSHQRRRHQWLFSANYLRGCGSIRREVPYLCRSRSVIFGQLAFLKLGSSATIHRLLMHRLADNSLLIRISCLLLARALAELRPFPSPLSTPSQ